MKKFLIITIVSISLITVFTGCNKIGEVKEVDKGENEVTDGAIGKLENEAKDNANELIVDIESNSEHFSDFYNERSFKFTPVLTGDIPNNIQYHWIIDNPFNTNEPNSPRPFELFYLEEGGGALEVVNNGEIVQFGVFAEVSYINLPEQSTPTYFDIILKVEDKNTLEVLAEKKIIIENRAGEYKIIRTEMTKEDQEKEKEDTIKRVAFERLEEKDKVNLDKDYTKAKIEKVILKEEMGVILNERFLKEEVYMINYPDKDSGFDMSNKVVFVNEGFMDIIGYGFID